MKVLLDENLDHRLRSHLGTHEVFTASYKGWDRLKNGALLRMAEEDGFEVLVTGDRTLSYEQNLTRRPWQSFPCRRSNGESSRIKSRRLSQPSIPLYRVPFKLSTAERSAEKNPQAD